MYIFLSEINETSNEVRLEVFDRAKPLDGTDCYNYFCYNCISLQLLIIK